METVCSDSLLLPRTRRGCRGLVCQHWTVLRITVSNFGSNVSFISLPSFQNVTIFLKGFPPSIRPVMIWASELLLWLLIRPTVHTSLTMTRCSVWTWCFLLCRGFVRLRDQVYLIEPLADAETGQEEALSDEGLHAVYNYKHLRRKRSSCSHGNTTTFYDHGARPSGLFQFSRLVKMHTAWAHADFYHADFNANV